MKWVIQLINHIKKISNNDIDKTIEIANQYGNNSMRYKWKQKTAGENTYTELNLDGNS